LVLNTFQEGTPVELEDGVQVRIRIAPAQKTG
jgi:hypothetical protein